MLPQANVYPSEMRSTRVRRRMHLMRKRAELLAHIQNTNSQYNLDPFEKKIAYKKNNLLSKICGFVRALVRPGSVW